MYSQARVEVTVEFGGWWVDGGCMYVGVRVD